MRINRVQTTEVTTAVILQGGWLKLLQAQSSRDGQGRLLGMKARHLSDLSEEAVADALKELIHALPATPEEILGLLSTGELLTRYLVLPSQDPEELKAMAAYQLEGLLPYPIQECVTSVKVLGSAGEGTRVLVAAVHRPVVERLLRICRKAGLNLTRLSASSEAIGHWNRACWPAIRGDSPRAWLVAELTREGLDIGVLAEGILVYMRQVPHSIGGLGELAVQLQETIRAYAREQVGPPVEQVTLSGWLDGVGSTPLEPLEAALKLPVHRVDPLETSPFRETLSVTAQELSPEVSFSELLGAACAPRLLELDLLPLEHRERQAQQALFRELRRSAVLIVLGVALLLGWAGARIGGTWIKLRQTQRQIVELNSKEAQVKAMAAAIRAVKAARQEYALQLERLGQSAKSLLPGMTLQFLGFEADAGITLRGTAADLRDVTRYAEVLRKDAVFGKDGGWETVTLRSAKAQPGGAGVEFEMVLKSQKRGQP